VFLGPPGVHTCAGFVFVRYTSFAKKKQRKKKERKKERIILTKNKKKW